MFKLIFLKKNPFTVFVQLEVFNKPAHAQRVTKMFVNMLLAPSILVRILVLSLCYL